MNDFTTQFHTNANETRLTDAERSRMQRVLRENMVTGTPTLSPFFGTSFLFSRAVAALGLMLVLTGGVTYASEQALPGDLLYPVKVSVTEPLSGAFVFSSQAQAQWHADIAETRLAEAEVLAREGALTAETSAELAKRFNKHAEAIAYLDGAATQEAVSTATDFSSAFSSRTAQRSVAILTAGKRSNNSVALRASGDFVVTVSRRNTHSMETASFATDISSDSAVSLKSAVPTLMMQTAERDMDVRSREVRDALAQATSTLAVTTLSEADALDVQKRIADIETRIVKGEAEVLLGNHAVAEADFDTAFSDIASLTTLLLPSEDMPAELETSPVKNRGNSVSP